MEGFDPFMLLDKIVSLFYQIPLAPFAKGGKLTFNFVGAASCCKIIYSLAPSWERVRVRGCSHPHMVPQPGMRVYPGNTVSRIRTVSRESLRDVELGSC